MTDTTNKIREWREAAGLSVVDLASVLKVSAASVYAWEMGKAVPASHRAFQLAKALRVAPSRVALEIAELSRALLEETTK